MNKIQAVNCSIEHSVTQSLRDPAAVHHDASTNPVGRSMLSERIAVQTKDANENTVEFQECCEKNIVENISRAKNNISLLNTRSIKSCRDCTVSEVVNEYQNIDRHHPKLNVSKKNEIQSTEKLTKKHFRSKAVLVKPPTANAECLAKPMMVDKKCSPIHIPTDKSSSVPLTVTSSHTITDSSHSEYQPSPEEILDLHEEQDMEMKRVSLRLINYFITVNSKSYIGIPSQWLWIIDEIQKVTSIPSDHIKLVLMKLKMNDTFRRLGDQFGLSSSAASKIFNRNIDQIAHLLKPFIFCPTKNSLQKNLPIPFRMNFSNVTGIIDCFEIQIEKPSNLIHQALTWSEYKKCNTLKFLICITADRLIIFISKGYGGRVSDVELFDKCGIMDILPANSSIMADRGFKQIQTILQRKNIQLVRPPSVSTQEKLSKEQVILTKRIASLRIHVERVIRRMREFSSLQPHSTLDHSIMPYIDSVIQIAAALINLQEPVIKT